jgi:hypothetical protein
MAKISANVVKLQSDITYNYATITITQSRIDKGLLAIPVGLAESFPEENKDIEVYLSDSTVPRPKRYSSYNSSTRECRIGGLKEWFVQNNIERGEEVVVQFLDKEHFIYRLIPEKEFVLTTKNLQKDFDSAGSEIEASSKVKTLSKWTLSDESEVVINEYQRLATDSLLGERQYVKKNSTRSRENLPANLRTLLSKIYLGHCQICDFWFLQRDNQPYFEVHHLNPQMGHHPKNILVVCGNCHNQFEYTNVHNEFDDERWLVQVFFNEKVYLVKQVLLSLKKRGFTKETYI